MKNENKRGKKSPRKHNPAWRDNTTTQRQQNRREKLNEIAKAAGFASWSAYETAVINNAVRLAVRPDKTMEK